MKRKYLMYISIIIISCASALGTFVYSYETRDNENWIGPYLSGAANLSVFGNFIIDEQEVIKFKELPVSQQYKYNFDQSGVPVQYTHNPIGYCYLIKIATLLLPFFGDATALVIFQFFIHLILCLGLIYLHRNNNTFIIYFAILYMSNPIILHFVVLNYYYFWQCIPAFIILYLLSTKIFNVWAILLLTVLLAFATLSRPTIILLTCVVFGLYYYLLPMKFATFNLLILNFIFFGLNKPMDKNIWHTMFVGIAAYPNSYVSGLSDDTGYELYEKNYQVELNASTGGNYYNKEVIEGYKILTKTKVIEIFKANPQLFARNAFLNVMQSFSVGYLVGAHLIINILLALSGIIISISFWKSHQRFMLICILLYAITFALYYPPIQAYLFGIFILSIVTFYNSLSFFYPRIFPKLNMRIPMQKVNNVT